MLETLLLKSSDIFDHSTLIDQIRQSSIDLENQPDLNEVKSFLKKSEDYLEKNLQFDEINELFSTILSCFSHFTDELMPILENYFKKSRTNAYYILLATSISTYLILHCPKTDVSCFQKLINDMAEEMYPQLLTQDNIIKIFGNEIPPQFINELILNIALFSIKKQKQFSKLCNYIFNNIWYTNNPNFDVFLQEYIKSDYYEILPQTNSSNDEIFNFISKGDSNLLQMSEEALSLIRFIISYVRVNNKSKIEGLTKEIILPFIAVLSKFIKKLQNIEKLHFSFEHNFNLIENAIQSLLINDDSLLNVSIDTILNNHLILGQSNFLPLTEFIQILSILATKLISNEYKSNKMILIKTIFALLSSNNDSSFSDQLETFQINYLTGIFNVITQNLTDFYKNRFDFKFKSINLYYVDQNLVRNHFYSMKTTDDVISTIYLFDNVCTNQPIIPYSFEVSTILVETIIKQIENKKYDDVLMIAQFMKNNDFEKQLQEIDEIPKIIKKDLFDNITINYESIDDLLIDVLHDQNLEKHDFLLEKLNDFLVADEDNLFSYISFLVNLNTENQINDYISRYYNECVKYNDMLVKVTNLYFYFNVKYKYLIIKNSFNVDKLPISSLSTSTISKLLEFAKNNPTNYQAFLCLKSIASTIPNAFHSNIQDVFDAILAPFDNLYLIFEIKSNNNDNLLLAKTAYAALSFLVSTLHSCVTLHRFLDWIFGRFEKFSNSQIFGFVYILKCILIDNAAYSLFSIYIEKYYILDKLAIVLEREVNESNIFKKNYKEFLMSYIQTLYAKISKYTPYVIAQNDAFSKKENPYLSIYSIVFSGYPYYGMKTQQDMYSISNNFHDYISNIEKIRKFWLTYNRSNYDVPNKVANDFISKLKPSENFVIPKEYSVIEKPITFRMAKTIVMTPFWFYAYFLFSKDFHLVKELSEEFIEKMKEINQIRQKSVSNPVDENDDDIESVRPIDRFLPLFCKPLLISNVIDQFATQKCPIYHFRDMIINEIQVPLYLEQISEKLTKYSYCSETINNLIDILNEFTNQSNFSSNFVDLCGRNLINAVLLPKNRCQETLLLKVSKLLYYLKEVQLPINTIHLICFLFKFKKADTITSALKLCSKLDQSQLQYYINIILDSFDNELKEGGNAQLLFDFCKNVPLIFKERHSQLFSILEDQMVKYKNDNDSTKFELICYLMNGLAPKRDISINIPTNIEYTSTIPENIMNSSPKFWTLYEKYSQIINQKVIDNPLLLDDKLSFILEYPEIMDFKIRSSYFRKIMKRRISNNTFRFTVDFNDLLQTSFQNLNDKSAEDILRIFKISIVGSNVIDAGGVTKEWFTRLAKEIFNQNYALFDCTGNDKGYRPSIRSYVHQNYLEYFKLAGRFIARALIEGICIDVHLSSSFCKQILHTKTDLKDLKDIDESLFNSSQWILQNDADSLSFYFEIDTDDFGEHKTIPLKENGSNIKVTNENKKEFIDLRTNYVLNVQIQKQIEAFCNGFDELIPHKYLSSFTPKELDLLICGVPSIDVVDFEKNMAYENPYNAETPVIKLFFETISKWDNDDLSKLLMFMTGSSRVPSNGFKEFADNSGYRLKIMPGGDKSRLPRSHTCFNQLELPRYESLEEMDKKLKQAIQMCNTFENE